jgi:hypothetical protein
MIKSQEHTFRFDFLHARQAVDTLFFHPGPKVRLSSADVLAWSGNEGPGTIGLKLL